MVLRVFNIGINPDYVYFLYGFLYVFHRSISLFSYFNFFFFIFCYSSYIFLYLLFFGYYLSPVVQTFSNFCTELKHYFPFLVSVGLFTFFVYVLSFFNAYFSSTSFRLSLA